jgi:hypothetical protein
MGVIEICGGEIGIISMTFAFVQIKCLTARK